MKSQKDIVKNVIEKALTDQSNATALLNNPAQTMRAAGYILPSAHDERFNSHFERYAKEISSKLSLISSGKDLSGEATLGADPVACTICQVSSYTLAIAIVSIGVAGLAVLTVESGVVIALAAFAGISAEAALAFTAGLSTAVAGGVDAVVMQICHWVNACD